MGNMRYEFTFFAQPTKGFRAVNPGKRLKSLSIVQSSLTHVVCTKRLLAHHVPAGLIHARFEGRSEAQANSSLILKAGQRSEIQARPRSGQ